MSLFAEVGMRLKGLWLFLTWCFVAGLQLGEAECLGVGMRLGLEGLAELVWQELSPGGLETGDCGGDGPEIGVS